MAYPVDHIVQRAEARVGAVVGEKYHLKRLLGVGGMAAVYLAEHRNANRVALKMLHLELSLDQRVRSRFLQEGYAANRVDHPCAVRVLDDDTTDDGSAFLVMELLDGETLEQRVERLGKLPHREVMDAALQLLDVLCAARAKGIVHRDIKPDNLFLMSDGTLKILDFGLARVQNASSAHATVSGHVFGTPAFMSPEQARGRNPEIDHQSDIFAAGATLFNLLSGRIVHEATTAAEVLLSAAQHQAVSLGEAAPDTPLPIVEVVDRALKFKKSERWPDAASMLAALREAYKAVYGEEAPVVRDPRPMLVRLEEDSSSPAGFQQGVGMSAAVSVPQEAPTLVAEDTMARRTRVVWFVGIGAAAGLLVAAGVLIGATSSPSNPNPAASAPVSSSSSPPAPDEPIAEPVEIGSVFRPVDDLPVASASASGKPRTPRRGPRPKPTKRPFDYQ